MVRVLGGAPCTSLLPWNLDWTPCAVYCISHESYRRTLYLGRGGTKDQDARVRHARCVCRSHSQKYRYTKNRPMGCNGRFVNGTYTPSARDVRVHLSLVALPFPSRASGDKICGRYNIRRKVPNQESKAAGEVHGAPPKTLTINTGITLIFPRLEANRRRRSRRDEEAWKRKKRPSYFLWSRFS